MGWGSGGRWGGVVGAKIRAFIKWHAELFY